MATDSSAAKKRWGELMSSDSISSESSDDGGRSSGGGGNWRQEPDSVLTDASVPPTMDTRGGVGWNDTIDIGGIAGGPSGGPRLRPPRALPHRRQVGPVFGTSSDEFASDLRARTRDNPDMYGWDDDVMAIDELPLDADPLAIRGIDTDMAASELSNLQLVGWSAFGPVWTATHGMRTHVRLFGVRPAFSSLHSRARFLTLLLNTLGQQVLLSHPALARPIGVIRKMDSADPRWVHLVYRAEGRSGGVEMEDLKVAVHTVLQATRFLDAVSTEFRISLVDPSLFLANGGEMACWGLIGRVAGMWVDPRRSCVAPELVSHAVYGGEGSAAFALGSWTKACRVKVESGGDFDLDACLLEDRSARPSLVCTAYAILAALDHRAEGWTWVHYACMEDDAAALNHYLEEANDTRGGSGGAAGLLSNPTCNTAPRSLLSVAVQHGSATCTQILVKSGCDTSEANLTSAVLSGSLEVVDLVIAAGTALTASDVADAPDDELYAALLGRFEGDLDVLVPLVAVRTNATSRLALLGRSGVELGALGLDANDNLEQVFEEACQFVLAGDHPLDQIEASVSAPTVAGSVLFGPGEGLDPGGNSGGSMGGGVSIPGWIYAFQPRDFQRLKPVGSGGFGVVYKADLHGAAVALKILSLGKAGRGLKKPTEARALMDEVAAHARIRHPHVLLMLGLVVDRASNTVGIVSEYMGGGDLAVWLDRARNGGLVFQPVDRARVLGQAADGIAFLHAQGMIHRDIKPANILLTAGGDAKVGDLGLASVEGGREGWTRTYAAPEIWLRTGHSSFASDVYSYAMTVYATMTLAVLPSGNDRVGREKEVPWVVADDPAVPVAGPWWVAMMLKSLAVVARDRPTTEEWKDVWVAVNTAEDAEAGAFFGLVVSGHWNDALDVARGGEGRMAWDNVSALSLALEMGAPCKVITDCILRGCNPDQIMATGRSPIVFAAEAGNLELVRVLIEAGASVDACAENGYTALMAAAHAGDLDLLNALLGFGANPNASRFNGWTALVLGARCGHLDIVTALLASGADVNVGSFGGWGPLFMSAARGDLEFTKVLIAGGADVNATKDDGATALMTGAATGSVPVVDFLAEAGANVNAADREGWTALLFGSANGFVDVVDSLLEAGANVNATETDHWTALMLAAQNTHVEVVGALVAAGADVNAATDNGWTALTIASRKGHTEVVNMLIEAGATRPAETRDDPGTAGCRIS